MTNSWEYLAKLRETLKELQKIKAKADPASGISFIVRRGVLRDDDLDEYDSENRPSIGAEFGDFELANTALDAIIKGVEGSIVYFTRVVRQDIETATKILGVT